MSTRDKPGDPWRNPEQAKARRAAEKRRKDRKRMERQAGKGFGDKQWIKDHSGYRASPIKFLRDKT